MNNNSNNLSILEKQYSSNTLEEVTDTVVGISKMRNIGNSVFTLNSASDFKFRIRSNSFKTMDIF